MATAEGNQNRDYGPCPTDGCDGRRKQRKSDLCPRHMTQRRAVEKNQRYYYRRQLRDDEAGLDAMVAANIEDKRIEPWLEAAQHSEASEPARAMSPEGYSFWRKWYDNPDCPVTTETLDAAGWGVTVEDITYEEGLERLRDIADQW